MKEFEPEQVEAFASFMQDHDFFYIAGHKEPDGDCISASLGIAAIAKAFGKPYQLLSAGPFKRIEIQEYKPLFSDTMTFLSEAERRRTGLLVCDCSEIVRLGEINGDFKNLDTFVIDHHKTAGCPERAQCIIDADAPAASALVQRLYERCIGPVDKNLAEILFFGLMTDTGFFRFLTDKDADALHCAARLVSAGANPRDAYDRMTSGKSYSSRKLLGVMLEHAERHLDGRLVVTYETMEDTKKYGQEGRDSDMLYSALLSIKNVEAAVFVRQETDATCTAGFRSKGNVDVSAIAARFGGGGHKNASGMSAEGRLDTLIPAIIKEFARIM
ncbi:MAG: bifunctional oligoribonuclease/PAP phosphatase NrnA [Treponemataceae bacterium]|nr:bifunctional oligoribonuclease/PAP phosphatase NrnA [Treponemataceae bacterium]